MKGRERRELKALLGRLYLRLREMMVSRHRMALEYLIAEHRKIEAARTQLGEPHYRGALRRKRLIARFKKLPQHAPSPRAPSTLKHPLDFLPRRLVVVSPSEAEALASLPYRQYLETPYWQAVRRAIYELRGAKCEQCGNRNTKLDIHHLTYARRGCEWPQDLKIICRDCHERHHTKHQQQDTSLASVLGMVGVLPKEGF